MQESDADGSLEAAPEQHPPDGEPQGLGESVRATEPEQTKVDTWEEEHRPRWLVALGVALLIGLLLVAAFSLGVYVDERGFFRGGP